VNTVVETAKLREIPVTGKCGFFVTFTIGFNAITSPLSPPLLKERGTGGEVK
jgi:hypothetical protein